ncbi:MAG: gliding motility-associated C-terminal domain-containing protein [Ferruginibacter sp.]
MYAQLCQGSLGDPIVNITFGSGTNPGAPLSAATTSYQYAGADCPIDGSYTVRTNSSNCFGGNWFTLNSDHTGDASGYFMLVNASYQPSAFYLDTVKGLCGGTTYEFAAWIVNMINPAKAPGSIEPNLTFSIETNTDTVTYNTNNIPSGSTPEWKQYGFFFKTPPAVTSVVLRIYNNAPGGNGNDIGLDDITFRPCGPQLVPSIAGAGGTISSVCEGIAKSFTFSCSVSAGFNNPTFQWQQNTGGTWVDIAGEKNTSLTQNVLTTTPAGNYLYRLTVAEAGNLGSPQCRIASQPITIQVNKNPTTTAANNGPVCTRSTLQLTATGGTQYAWIGANNFSAAEASPQIGNIQPVSSGKYIVTVKNAEGCEHKDSTVVVVNPTPTASVLPTTASICQGDSIQLKASGGNSYEWIPAVNLSSSTTGNPYASPKNNTRYLAIVSNQFMCKDSAEVNITVINKPTADAGHDRTIIAGNSILLLANATGTGLVYTWVNATAINDPHLLRPTINPQTDTRYILNVTSSNGCGNAEDTMFVKVYSAVYIPNAFTPNDDGINDTWNIPALSAYTNFEVYVYNRYGQLVFRNSNSNKGWDGYYKGKKVPMGAYTYYIDLKIANGLGKMTGTVMVIR